MAGGGGASAVARSTSAAVLLWPAALATALLWPLLSRPGHPLARDLVFVHRQPLTWQSAGLSDGSPRAVPLDAVVAVLTSLVDGAVLARVALPAILLIAAAGVVRLLAQAGTGRAGLVVAAGVTVWNPFVVERLALGQWALLAAYAALPWLVPALASASASDGRRGRDRLVSLGGVVGWAALASLTPTGGLVAVAAALAVALLRGRAVLVPLVAVVVLQAPWVAAALVGTASRVSDPAGVAAFAPDTEGRWGTVVALLGLGGIWDSGSEPASRAGVLAPLSAAVVVAVLAVAVRLLGRRVELARAWWVLGLGGLVVALAATTPPGQAALRVAVAHVPAAGLLRDTQKLLLPTALLVALAAGVVADRLARGLANRLPDAPEVRLVLVVPLVLAPVLLLPDGGRVVWRTVDPVDLPVAYADVVAETRGSDTSVVTLPWRSYRRFSWGNGSTSSDPLTRMLSAPVVVSDDLRVGPVLVAGESRLARDVGVLVAGGGPVREVAGLGVGWVVVHLDDPDAGALDLAGLEPVVADDEVALYRVPGAARLPGPSVPARVVLALAYAVVVTLLAGALAARLAVAARRPR